MTPEDLNYINHQKSALRHHTSLHHCLDIFLYMPLRTKDNLQVSRCS